MPDMKTVHMPSDLESRFLAYPTSAISDAMDELDLMGVLFGVAAMRPGQGRVCGRALTARLDRKIGDPAAWRFGGGVGKPLEEVLQRMRVGHVVLMDLGGATDASAWGGLASRLAQRRGVRGTVMWGACRDLEEIRQIGYPVWAVGTCPRRSRNSFTFGAIEEPVHIGSVTVAPEDWIVADETGVVAVPAARAGEVLDLVERVAAQEKTLEKQVRDDAVQSWDAI
jgi:regulator of RNase E activity RraA